jgi:hypothetical protein
VTAVGLRGKVKGKVIAKRGANAPLNHAAHQAFPPQPWNVANYLFLRASSYDTAHVDRRVVTNVLAVPVEPGLPNEEMPAPIPPHREARI